MLLVAACGRDGRYLGNAVPPSRQRLVYVDTYEPSSIDPAMLVEIPETNLSLALFEGLTTNNPFTMEPMAGMATHYETSADGRILTFYLRGHPAPKGKRLPGIDSLPVEYSHGVQAPTDSAPARWSDGTIVTAADFVVSLRRIFDPATGHGRNLSIVNSAEIVAGKRPASDLGAEAVDDFTLRLRLTVPAAYYLAAEANITQPVPRRAIEAARAKGQPDSWTRHGLIGNGPFLLDEWRPYDYIRLKKNPGYYLRDLVRLEELTLLPLPSGPAVINLFRRGGVHSIYTDSMPLSLVPALESKADFHRDPQYGVLLFMFNLHEPPFNDRRVRWALNMAIDKRALAKYWRSEPMRHVIPAMPGYTPPESRIVTVNGKSYDVMAYDPPGARELLEQAGYGANGKSLALSLNTTNDEQGRQSAEILKQLLEPALHTKVLVNPMDIQVLGSELRDHTSHGVTMFAWTIDGWDPYIVLGPEMIGTYADYRDPAYYAHVDAANRIADPALRLKELAACEAELMEAMVVLPMSGYPAVYLQKPYVRGLMSDKQGLIWYRYAWIDTEWKP
jgi:oligopeptide transport system substrate-binding protein